MDLAGLIEAPRSREWMILRLPETEREGRTRSRRT
jgi:hypothetical protein